MKYIIKNCPACRIYSAFGIDTETGCCYQFMGYCKNHFDCLLKQIVEKCKDDWEDTTVNEFQKEVLDLLDIQEIEE